MIVAKFGGSSLADAEQFQKVREIVRADSRRVFVVPSAPGRRFDGDDKVTDLLYQCHHRQTEGSPFTSVFAVVRRRYCEIARALNLALDMEPHLDEVERNIAAGASADYCASRGEYLNGLLLADYLGYDFLDPGDVIFFREDGRLDDEKTNTVLGARLQDAGPTVIPGFYGSLPDGAIRTFSRGGSDITGAIVARAAGAEVYENWTDVSGFLMADPRIVGDARPIRHITYHEMYELSRAGATVLHEDSVFPVSRAGIPTNIRNTNDPNHPGTMITCTAVQREDFAIFAGVAGKKGFSLLLAEKEEPDSSRTFARGVIQAAEDCALRFECLPTGINNVCLLANTEELQAVYEPLTRRLAQIKTPHSLTRLDRIALIVLVGYGVVHSRKTVARIYEALHGGGIGVHMLNQGNGELSTWVGVDEKDLAGAIRAIYREFADRSGAGASSSGGEGD